eukprot:Tbor_TRINITY_DN5506_c0_g2::TRINITY_DN5506_c0_g2_i1::g.13571::m.13571
MELRKHISKRTNSTDISNTTHKLLDVSTDSGSWFSQKSRKRKDCLTGTIKTIKVGLSETFPDSIYESDDHMDVNAVPALVKEDEKDAKMRKLREMEGIFYMRTKGLYNSKSNILGILNSKKKRQISSFRHKLEANVHETY